MNCGSNEPAGPPSVNGMIGIFRFVPENLGTESDTEMSFWGVNVYITIPKKVGTPRTEPRKRTSAFGRISRARNLARSPKNFSDTKPG